MFIGMGTNQPVVWLQTNSNWVQSSIYSSICLIIHASLALHAYQN